MKQPKDGFEVAEKVIASAPEYGEFNFNVLFTEVYRANYETFKEDMLPGDYNQWVSELFIEKGFTNTEDENIYALTEKGRMFKKLGSYYKFKKIEDKKQKWELRKLMKDGNVFVIFLTVLSILVGIILTLKSLFKKDNVKPNTYQNTSNKAN